MHGGDHDQVKQRLRDTLTATRRLLPSDEAARRAAVVCSRVVALPDFARASSVVAYAPIGNEVDPAAIVVAAVVRGKGTFYPRTDGARLEFVHSRPEQLRPGWHGIPEPDGNEYLAPLAHDVLFLVPGVAFASNGARLGRGAGCYDRALARYPHGSRAGLAYEMQLVAAIPEDPWDQRVDLVITEARVITVAAASRAETLE